MSTTEERTWRGMGWTAEIVDNEDGGGWALAMTPDGRDEPVLIVPWTMGRNKKDPKPLNKADFRTQVKAASDVLRRSAQQIRRAHRVSLDVNVASGERVRVVFDVIPDEVEPEGELVCSSLAGVELGRASCPAHLKLTRARAIAWVDGGCRTVYGDD
ncbi:MAG: hypothetical protein GY913_18955 [Proteobacteria bacterium]|nr:hypothetical protein [Pseudomonadota bacterium]MCP4918989.1 hypothetical protein [Pseudomonadota bacterium]